MQIPPWTTNELLVASIAVAWLLGATGCAGTMAYFMEAAGIIRPPVARGTWAPPTMLALGVAGFFGCLWCLVAGITIGQRL